EMPGDGVQEAGLPPRPAVCDHRISGCDAGLLEDAAQLRLILETRAVGRLDQGLPEQIARAGDVTRACDAVTGRLTGELGRRTCIENRDTRVLEALMHPR